MFVVLDISELRAISAGILLQRPVGRRRDYEVHRYVRNPRKIAGVAESEAMGRLIKRRRPWNGPEVGVGFAIDAQRRGGVVIQGKLK
jgi:hypothetical protein